MYFYKVYLLIINIKYSESDVLFTSILIWNTKKYDALVLLGKSILLESVLLPSILIWNTKKYDALVPLGKSILLESVLLPSILIWNT